MPELPRKLIAFESRYKRTDRAYCRWSEWEEVSAWSSHEAAIAYARRQDWCDLPVDIDVQVRASKFVPGGNLVLDYHCTLRVKHTVLVQSMGGTSRV